MPQGARYLASSESKKSAMQRCDTCLDDSMTVAAVRILGPQERALLLEIARCPLIPAAIRDAGHPCHRVAGVQPIADAGRQVPEGWAGNLRSARVVFLSSNPSISLPVPGQSPETAEAYPVASCTDEHIARYLGHRFDQAVGPKPFVRDSRHLQLDGQYAAKPTQFWVSMRRRAIELLGPDADPSRNYVMTEVVHCKSKGEDGVASAALTCASRYLDKIFYLTAAPVVIVVGMQAHAMLKARFPDLPDPQYIHTKELGGMPRELVFIWHPASRKTRKTIAGLYGPECLNRLRALAATPTPELLQRSPEGKFTPSPQWDRQDPLLPRLALA
jgi:hypothetical protein